MPDDQAPLCPCCHGAGTLPVDEPLCPCATQQRDARGHDILLHHELLRLRFLQAVALHGHAFHDQQPLPPRDTPYRDYRADQRPTDD